MAIFIGLPCLAIAEQYSLKLYDSAEVLLGNAKCSTQQITFIAVNQLVLSERLPSRPQAASSDLGSKLNSRAAHIFPLACFGRSNWVN